MSRDQRGLAWTVVLVAVVALFVWFVIVGPPPGSPEPRVPEFTTPQYPDDYYTEPITVIRT
jgi:hypothetical protein